MKREILCVPCHTRIAGKLGDYPGEHEKSVFGKSKSDFFCDGCIRQIAPGTQCYAFSIWTDKQGYVAWEQEYISEAF